MYSSMDEQNTGKTIIRYNSPRGSRRRVIIPYSIVAKSVTTKKATIKKSLNYNKFVQIWTTFAKKLKSDIVSYESDICVFTFLGLQLLILELFTRKSALFNKLVTRLETLEWLKIEHYFSVLKYNEKNNKKTKKSNIKK